MAPQNPAPPLRKKSQEKSNLKKNFSHKKHSSEEPKRAGTTDVSSPESRPSKRPSFLYMCVGGHRPSISSSLGEQAYRYHSNTAAAQGWNWSLEELFPEQHGEGPGEEERDASRPSPHIKPHCLDKPEKPLVETVFRDPHRPRLSAASAPHPGSAEPRQEEGGDWETGDLGSELHFLCHSPSLCLSLLAQDTCPQPFYYHLHFTDEGTAT